MAVLLGMLVVVSGGTGERSGVQRPDGASPSGSAAPRSRAWSGCRRSARRRSARRSSTWSRRAARPRRPAEAGVRRPAGTEVALVNQRGLQFAPRVQAIALGQTVRFTNQDTETHNVHVVSPGFAFNQSMTPGRTQDFTPERPGVMMLACDVHSHMRGYVVVSPTPWVQVCSRRGAVPARGRPRRPVHPERLARDGRAAAARRSPSRAARRSTLPELVLAGPSAPVRAAGHRDGPVAALGRGDRPDRHAAGGEPGGRDAVRRAGQGRGGWPRTPTGASSRRPTWRPPCVATWASRGPASSSGSSAGSAPRSARWPRAAGPRRHWTTGATSCCSTWSSPRAS